MKTLVPSTKKADPPVSTPRHRRGGSPLAAPESVEILVPLDEDSDPEEGNQTTKTTQTTKSNQSKALEDPVVLEPAPATGRIKLEVGNMTHTQLLTQLQQANVGMNGTPAYSALPVMAEVSAAASGFAAILANIAADEIALQERRQIAAQWARTYGGVLQKAAIACEAADSTPATLLSGGWKLRKAPGPAQQMSAPAGLKLIQSGYPGEGIGNWKKVPNARYYELRIDPVANTTNTITEPVVLSSPKTRLALPTVPPGTQLMLCVRAIGGKGPGPFCERLEVRVN